MNKPSGSSLVRARHCPASFALPSVATESSKEARGGTQVHAVLQAVNDGASIEEALALATLPSAVEIVRGIEFAKLPRGESEVKFAYNVRTGSVRRLAEREHRDYSAATDDECVGTADLVQWSEEPLTVLDWKTARFDFDVEQSRPQLEFYALCAARLAGVDRVRWKIGVISNDGAIGYHARELDGPELWDVADSVRDAWERVAAAHAARAAAAEYEPDVSMGYWCRYCPAFRACPALRREVQSVLGLFPDEVSPELLGDAYARTRVVLRVAEALAASAKAALQHVNALATSDGREVILDGRGSLRIRRA